VRLSRRADLMKPVEPEKLSRRRDLMNRVEPDNEFTQWHRDP